MSHIEEEFEQIEQNHEWNMLFRVRCLFVSFRFIEWNVVFFSIRNWRMNMAFEH